MGEERGGQGKGREVRDWDLEKTLESFERIKRELNKKRTREKESLRYEDKEREGGKEREMKKERDREW